MDTEEYLKNEFKDKLIRDLKEENNTLKEKLQDQIDYSKGIEDDIEILEEQLHDLKVDLFRLSEY